MTASNDRTTARNNFDLIRIAAALQVLVGHGLAHLGLERPAWWTVVEAFPGVPIFFVISGFLISRSYEHSSSLASYARNRALRIYPALWACIGLTLVAASFAGTNFFNAQAVIWLPAQLLGLIYTPAFLKGFGFGSYNGSLWTILIELQFYCLLPVCYALLPAARSLRTKGLIALLIVFTAFAMAHAAYAGIAGEGGAEPAMQKLIRYSFAPHFYLFLAGVVFQRLAIDRWRFVAGKGMLWLAAYLLFHFAVPQSPWTSVTGSLILSICVLSIAFTAPGLAHRVLRGNDISYGCYIYHGLVINVFLTLGWQKSQLLLPILMAVTLALSLASWKLIEKPALRMKTRVRSNVDSEVRASMTTGEAPRAIA